MPAPATGKTGKEKRNRAKRAKHAKREQGALRMLRKSLEQQVRLAYAKIPLEATALSQERLTIRASLVSRGYLTVEELESLPKNEAIATALRHLTERVQTPGAPSARKRKRT